MQAVGNDYKCMKRVANKTGAKFLILPPSLISAQCHCPFKSMWATTPSKRTQPNKTQPWASLGPVLASFHPCFRLMLKHSYNFLVGPFNCYMVIQIPPQNCEDQINTLRKVLRESAQEEVTSPPFPGGSPLAWFSPSTAPASLSSLGSFYSLAINNS